MEARRLHILLVDDEVHILDFMERVLRAKNTITRTTDPLNAVELLKNSKFDLLISDQKMPKMTGLELLAKAAQLQPDMVRMVISGYTEQEQMDLSVERGELHNYILKPVNRQQVLSAIEIAWDNYRARSGAP